MEFIKGARALFMSVDKTFKCSLFCCSYRLNAFRSASNAFVGPTLKRLYHFKALLEVTSELKLKYCMPVGILIWDMFFLYTTLASFPPCFLVENGFLFTHFFSSICRIFILDKGLLCDPNADRSHLVFSIFLSIFGFFLL